MKKVVLKTRIVALALATLFTVSLTSLAITRTSANKPAELNYVGYVNDLPVYQLKLNNEVHAKYLVTIKDKEGNVVYSEKLNGLKLTRNYQFVDAPVDNYSLIFVVSNIGTNQESVYTINKTSKATEAIAVNKIK